MSDVILNLGADSDEFWKELHAMEAGAAKANERTAGGVSRTAAAIQTTTAPMRQFVGSLRGALGLVTGMIGLFTGVGAVVGLVGGLIGGAIVRNMERANEQAREFSRLFAEQERAGIRNRLAGPGVAQDEVARRRLAEFEARDQNRLANQRIADAVREGKLREDAANRLYDRERELHQERLANIRERFAIERALRESEHYATLRATAGAADERAQGFLRRGEGEAERIRREAAELEEQVRAAWQLLNDSVLDAGHPLIEQIRQQADAMLAELEARAAEASQRIREDAALSERALEAELLRLRGDEQAARLAEIRLDLERRILDVQRQQGLTDEERERRIALLRERAALQEAQAREGAAQPTRFVGIQAGLVGGASLATRALGLDTPDQRMQRELEAQTTLTRELVRRLSEIVSDVSDIRDRREPIILG